MKFAFNCILFASIYALSIVNESFPLLKSDVQDLCNSIQSLPINTVKQYDSEKFLAIRQAFGINQEGFLNSFNPESVFYTRLTSEKSGSRFFFSGTGNFLVKKVARRESETLRKISRDYTAYMTTHSNDTLINPIIFHARVMRGSQRSYYIIMTSSVPGVYLVGQDQMDQVFDMKGSSFDRYKDPSKVSKGDALLDNNWIQSGNVVSVNDSERALLKSVMNRDSEFLMKCNLWDYSLFTALTFNGQGTRIESGHWNQGILGSEGRYYFAIIDVRFFVILSTCWTFGLSTLSKLPGFLVYFAL